MLLFHHTIEYYIEYRYVNHAIRGLSNNTVCEGLMEDCLMSNMLPRYITSKQTQTTNDSQLRKLVSIFSGYHHRRRRH